MGVGTGEAPASAPAAPPSAPARWLSACVRPPIVRTDGHHRQRQQGRVGQWRRRHRAAGRARPPRCAAEHVVETPTAGGRCRRLCQGGGLGSGRRPAAPPPPGALEGAQVSPLPWMLADKSSRDGRSPKMDSGCSADAEDWRESIDAGPPAAAACGSSRGGGVGEKGRPHRGPANHGSRRCRLGCRRQTRIPPVLGRHNRRPHVPPPQPQQHRGAGEGPPRPPRRVSPAPPRRVDGGRVGGQRLPQQRIRAGGVGPPVGGGPRRARRVEARRPPPHHVIVRAAPGGGGDEREGVGGDGRGRRAAGRGRRALRLGRPRVGRGRLCRVLVVDPTVVGGRRLVASAAAWSPCTRASAATSALWAGQWVNPDNRARHARPVSPVTTRASASQCHAVASSGAASVAFARPAPRGRCRRRGGSGRRRSSSTQPRTQRPGGTRSASNSRRWTATRLRSRRRRARTSTPS